MRPGMIMAGGIALAPRRALPALASQLVGRLAAVVEQDSVGGRFDHGWLLRSRGNRRRWGRRGCVFRCLDAASARSAAACIS